jgi:IclR family KDG regulon transcriptional repressor
VDPEAVIARPGIIRERLDEKASGEEMDAVNVLAALIFRGQGERVGTIGINGASRDIPSRPPIPLLIEIQSAAAALSKRLNSDAYARVLCKSR